ncbi:hypothetical protein SPKIRA_22590 [Sphingomonas paucimobilis]|uniref:DNA, contig: SP623 n=1 Tax=Sphingomonas paucimobilis NBRC 13935 TaxID=1219050 RepID=A0A0C9N2E9_SPHPI|nr:MULTISPECIES: hypothetical protein [Sphingomonas]BCI71429.1 hypothetical protein SPKIRA_22590 [Sphingomonas paucimobilis]GAN13704.1 hypothetical protein SP6_23_01050 [Sphingomonas paucimobilis NBRC 13935]
MEQQDRRLDPIGVLRGRSGADMLAMPDKGIDQAIVDEIVVRDVDRTVTEVAKGSWRTCGRASWLRRRPVRIAGSAR